MATLQAFYQGDVVRVKANWKLGVISDMNFSEKKVVKMRVDFEGEYVGGWYCPQDLTFVEGGMWRKDAMEKK